MARMRCLGSYLVLFCLSTFYFCLCPPALASPTPPPTGDWTIEVGEDVALDGQDLTLPGNLIIYGRLVLNGGTLRLGTGHGLWTYGRLEATDALLTGTTWDVSTFLAGGTSVNTFIRCRFDLMHTQFGEFSQNILQECTLSRGRWGGYFEGDSTNTLTDCVFDGPDPATVELVFRDRSHSTVTRCEIRAYGWTADNAYAEFTGCTFKDYEFHSPSVSVLDHCTFTRNARLFALEGVQISYAGFVPGPQDATVIASSGANPFSVSFLNGTQVPFLSLSAHADAQAQFSNSTLNEVQCQDSSHTTFTDSEVAWLQIWTRTGHFIGRGGAPCPYATATVDVAVDGFRDAVVQDASITGNGLPLVTLTRTRVEQSNFSLGDNGGSTPSVNTINNSTVRLAWVSEHASLTATGSTLFGGIEGWYIPADSDATFRAVACMLTGLYVDGADTTVILQDSDLIGELFFWNWWQYYNYNTTAPCSPKLELEGTVSFASDSYRVFVRTGVQDARISGDVTVDPTRRVVDWSPGSTVIRQFPVLVNNHLSLPVVGAAVWVTDAAGEVIWEGVTDAEGCAYPEITFDQYNYDAEFRVKAWYPGWYASAPVRFLSSTPLVLALTGNTLAFTSFEQARSPWAGFAAGAGQAVPWRALGATGDLPPTHSGDYLMVAEVAGEAITGLRLDLPTEPTGPIPSDYTLRTWVCPEAATANTSTLVGFVLADDCVTPTATPSSATWEVLSPTTSRLWIGDTATPLGFGLSPEHWHLVQLKYDRVAHSATLWVNGVLVHEADASALAGQPVSYAMMGARSAAGAAALICFDDTSLTLGWPPDSPPPGECTHPYALLEGPEQMLSGQGKAYTLTYGNGYPVLGMGSFPASEGQKLYVGLSLPDDYTLASATPPPTRMVANAPVWELDPPEMGSEGQISLTWQTPEGLLSERTDRVLAWATADPGAVTTDPPNPPDWISPCRDPVWGCPRDLLPQRALVDEQLRPDLWVKKTGPGTASPGDTLGYIITVGNSGFAPAESITVKDRLPDRLGGGDRIVANLAELAPGDKWRGLLTAVLPWGVPGGTLLFNRAYVPTGVPELAYDNNSAEWTTTVQAAHDPNQITVSPAGGVQRGDTLTYTIQCENEGLGTAYGVYVSAELDDKLDEGTLSLPGGVLYDPGSRTLQWEVGTLAPDQIASTSFSVTVAGNARRACPIVGHATVYFPSVPEETSTNVVANIIAGTFSDVGWDHWAVLPVELAFENGIVGGYPDGTYRPTLSVSRDQMAVFISRALAGGDSRVPSGPPTATFSDVATSFWAFKYVEYARAHGVVGGYSDGTYRPAVPVDRGQMAVFVARALAGSDGAVPPAPPTPTFPDVTPTSTWAWAQKHVEYAVARGVVSGYPDGNYHPEIGVTRDQMAVFVQRAFELPM